jgi:hypothetical protein
LNKSSKFEGRMLEFKPPSELARPSPNRSAAATGY